MFLVIVIFILGACVIIVWSIYFNTISLQKTYWSVNFYYWAYYWAMSAIERWLLMSKLKYPSYESYGWFKWDTIIWSKSNMFSWEFWRLNQWNNSIMRSVDSKTTKISSYIDTKTLRTISFYQYTDPNPNRYTDNSINSVASGISKWLSFSWHTEPSKWTRNTENLKDFNMDFNRFFTVNNPRYIVRSLGYNFALDIGYQWDQKDSPLSWEFKFWNQNQSYNYNPRPAESWELNNNYTPHRRRTEPEENQQD